jgi:hypothetical protein
MVTDLTNRHLLIGLNSDEVTRLLGPPGSWSSDHSNCSYLVKIGGPGFNKVYVLDVGFDRTTKKVVSTRIRGD